jgi:hypothetical protein
MIYRVFPNADTFITNQQKIYVPQTASNFGASEVMQVFMIGPVSGATGAVATASYAHALVQFDLTTIAALTSSKNAPSTGVTYRLHLFDARSTGSLPNGYTMEVLALSQPWNEGMGYDTQLFSDLGAANWVQATNTSFWSQPGASGTLPQPFFFQTGFEDLDLDVTPIVNAWLTGGLTNNGFLVRLSSSLESGTGTYYMKQFFTRNTFVDNSAYMPYLQMQWDDSVRDDRNNFVFNNSGTLYLYNDVRGALTNIPSVSTGTNDFTVYIQDLSGTILTVSASWTGLPGIYSASFVLPSASYSGSAFVDIWVPSGSLSAVMTGNFYPSDTFSVQNVFPSQYSVSVVNLKRQYEQLEVPRISLFVRNQDYNPAVVLTASSGPNGLVITKAYYRIRNDRTNEDVIPFGTGSYLGGVDTTRLSYDQRGNYFKMYMSSLPTSQVYRITFMFDVDGEIQLVDEGFKFRVL